jgi:hypothetical protein
MEQRTDWPFGPALERHRVAAGLSVKAAARRTQGQVSDGRWYQLESGYQQIKGQHIPIGTKPATVAAVAQAVNWDVSEALRTAGFDPRDYQPHREDRPLKDIPLMRDDRDDRGKSLEVVLPYLANRPLTKEKIYAALEVPRSTFYDLEKKGELIRADRLITAARNLRINPVELLARYGLLHEDEVIAYAQCCLAQREEESRLAQRRVSPISAGPADAGLSHQQRAAEFVAHDRDRGLAVADLLGHHVARRAGEDVHGVSLP